MEFQLTNDIERQLKEGKDITIADSELLLCLRFTVKLSNIQGLAYRIETYVEVGDCLDSTYIDGAIIDLGSDLQTEVNKYLSNIKDAFEAATRQLRGNLTDAAMHDQIQSAVISYSGY